MINTKSVYVENYSFLYMYFVFWEGDNGYLQVKGRKVKLPPLSVTILSIGLAFVSAPPIRGTKSKDRNKQFEFNSISATIYTPRHFY